jgi:hypothetical protein
MEEIHTNIVSLRRTREGFRQHNARSTPSVSGATPGRVQHDMRGNAVWNWDVATGVIAEAKADELLRMLDNPALQIASEADSQANWAGDPYNRR